MAEHFGTYLNDHLAGSSLGLEILSLIQENSPDLTGIVAQLRQEFEGERNVIRKVMQKLDVAESPLRKVGGWLNAKLLDVKLRVDDSKKGEFFRFESLEAISVGMAGKHLMWSLLSTLAKERSDINFADYDQLAEQALSQRARVETLRVETAKKIFAS